MVGGTMDTIAQYISLGFDIPGPIIKLLFIILKKLTDQSDITDEIEGITIWCK